MTQPPPLALSGVCCSAVDGRLGTAVRQWPYLYFQGPGAGFSVILVKRCRMPSSVPQLAQIGQPLAQFQAAKPTHSVGHWQGLISENPPWRRPPGHPAGIGGPGPGPRGRQRAPRLRVLGATASVHATEDQRRVTSLPVATPSPRRRIMMPLAECGDPGGQRTGGSDPAGLGCQWPRQERVRGK